jgi:DNA mismatch repair ATPase MutS
MCLCTARYIRIRMMAVYMEAYYGVSDSIPFVSLERSNLEAYTLSVLDHTKTRMGRRLMREWIGRPLLDVT